MTNNEDNNRNYQRADPSSFPEDTEQQSDAARQRAGEIGYEVVPPEVELRQAAATLRELAAKATPGPWRYNPEKYYREPETLRFEEAVFAGPAGEAATTVALTGEVDDPQSMTDARWIATMSPVMAEPLAAWLEWEALAMRLPYALDIARRINRSRGDQ
ncbi:hypothetical protein SAMN05421805_12781 [Saccharopolyspora antimicrobica]|uniref:Uncharacterized protein n=1 Tax=Saccharopolyspora antimicrobica TaxID=455193 RepID=A0A1I5KNA7_9PSEU|nr:hypothetical protein [Saccharopolyspora antimicrobica]RKT85616.1 hypothetical protein ATL45_3963 [Saccharopolyspora antimicrobica]SFO86156.1 hypothetical protein SAMN05421805_12781 [Saccharopolyspora antimicrobica]